MSTVPSMFLLCAEDMASINERVQHAVDVAKQHPDTGILIPSGAKLYWREEEQEMHALSYAHDAHDVLDVFPSATAIVNRINVSVVIKWGRRWTGSHYETTVGEGAWYEVWDREHQFRGSLVGRGNTLEAAKRDFVERGMYEHRRNVQPSVSMLHVVSTDDYREKKR